MKTPPTSGAILVSDFDGTMTQYDFFDLVRERLLPPDTPDYWQKYRAGRMTHFEALRAIFASIRAGESEVLDILDAMKLDPALPQALSTLREAGWHVTVTSAGCEWYIRKLLDAHKVSLPVFANPGRFIPGKGLLMSLPSKGKYFSNTLGVDKAAVVGDALCDHRHVAFAGDGYPDLDAAQLVPARLRFAKGALAESATREGLDYIPFQHWSEIAAHLTKVPTT